MEDCQIQRSTAQPLSYLTLHHMRDNHPNHSTNYLSTSISRRRFVASASVLAAAAWLSPRRLFAEGENIVLTARKRAESATITTESLRENVSALVGSGGNIGVLSGSDGKVIIDSGYSTSRGKITEALRKLSRDPIKHLINTHWHFDHCDGNEWMHADGATILAHENTRQHLATTTRVDA